jgi:hypothetical protein
VFTSQLGKPPEDLMVDTIIMQGTGYTIAQTDEAGTNIAYGDLDHPGGRNHGFLDLRDHPELVAMIPKARDRPGMQAILRALNAPRFRFMSLGCERGVFPREDAKPGDPAFLCGSYIQVAYRDSRLNAEPARFVALAKAVIASVAPSTEHHIGSEMIVGPLRSFFGAADRYALMMKPVGYGNSEAEAIAAWEYAAHGIAIMFSRLRSECAPDFS